MGIKDGTIYRGTIDIENSTIIPQATVKHSATDSYNSFKWGGKIAMQLLSDDLSANVTWSLEVSLDGDNWDVAREGGTDVTGEVVKDEPYVEVFEALAGLYYRISLTVAAQTGTIEYILKDVRR
jgi:hypothetical protein